MLKGFGRAAPCTRGSAGRWPATSAATACILWDGEVGPVAGDAVNPSMEARSPHPCGSRPRNRTHPAFDRFLRSAVDPRHAWMNICQISKDLMRSGTRRCHRHREPVRGGAVWVGRTVGAMDGAIEPPWTGLRRVLPTHTAPPQTDFARLLVGVDLGRQAERQPRLAPTGAGAWLEPAEADAWFRDDARGHYGHRSTSKTIRRNMRAIAVIGIALLLNPILDLGENTAWR